MGNFLKGVGVVVISVGLLVLYADMSDRDIVIVSNDD
jgi:hypothetical protein